MEGGIKIIHVKNINQVIDLVEKKVPMFIKFYADWCGHCKSMVPEWHKIEEQAKGKNIAIVEVEESTMKQDGFMEKLKEKVSNVKVDGFPTIGTITYNNRATFKPYEGGRTADEMMKEVDKIKQSGGGKQSGGKQSGGKQSGGKKKRTKHKKRSTRRKRTNKTRTRRRY